MLVYVHESNRKHNAGYDSSVEYKQRYRVEYYNFEHFRDSESMILFLIT